jgi:hypothetical protein
MRGQVPLPISDSGYGMESLVGWCQRSTTLVSVILKGLAAGLTSKTS